MISTCSSRATAASRSVLGPGMGSARSNRAVSSRWQKYCARKSSGRQTICAPARAASRTRSAAFSRFASGSGEQDICTRPIRYFKGVGIVSETSSLMDAANRRKARAARFTNTVSPLTREVQLFLTEKLRSHLPAGYTICENGQLPAPSEQSGVLTRRSGLPRQSPSSSGRVCRRWPTA